MFPKLTWVLFLLSAVCAAVEPGGVHTYWYKGNQVQVQTLDGVTVQASVLNAGRYSRVDLRVLNRGTKSLHVQPESIALTAVADKDMEMETLSPRDIQKGVSEELLVGNLLNGFVPSANESPTNRVNWMPDGPARWTPYRVPPSSSETAANRRRQFNELLLRDTTVSPNESISGSVFFKGSRKYDGTLVTIGLGSRLFNFPFGAGAPPVAMAALDTTDKPSAATMPQTDVAPAPEEKKEANPNPLFYQLGIEVKPSRFEGLEITGITSYSPAAKAGLRATDDTILAVNGVPVKTADDINRILSGHESSKVTITIMHQYWQEEKVVTLH